MKKLIGLIIILFSTSIFASVPIEISMLQVVKESDHVLSVHIIGVDMVDQTGAEIENENAMTGPGKENLIRLICEVKKIHLSNVKNIPKTIKIPLNSFMHYSLGQIKKAYENPPYLTLVVLKGNTFKPAYAGIFEYPLKELETILALFKNNK